MTGVEIFKFLASGRLPDRIPFVPTIYEHAASLMHVAPSRMSTDMELIIQGQLAAYEVYRHDLISVGVDIYNVEAEALGCSVSHHGGKTVPSLINTLISDPSDLKNIRVPNPWKDGRMPMLVESVRIIRDKIGREVPVNGTIVGPFTLSAILRGYENFLMDLLFEKEFALRQLDFALEVGLAYAGAYVATGAGVAINESWIAPPLLSPNLFRNLVFPVEKELIRRMKAVGLRQVSLICGGDTAPIADMLVRTGTAMLMADAGTDQKTFKKLCAKHEINLRASIASKIVETGNADEMESAARKVIGDSAANGRFIFGCGVVSYDTPPENVLMLKEIVRKFNPYRG